MGPPAGAASAMTSLIRISDPFSMPLAAETRIVSFDNGVPPAIARMTWDGTAKTAISTSGSTWPTTSTASGSNTPGKKALFSRVSRNAEGWSSSRHHSKTR